MSGHEMTRRGFVGDGARVAAGVVAGAVGVQRLARAEQTTPRTTSNILNYNENMEYRRQGSTDLMFSAVCLGGHSRSNVQQRTEIISRCIDAGINYVDSCSNGEVVRDAKALKGRRDKMYLACSHCGHEVRNEKYRTAKKLLEALDETLLAANLDRTDLWRITCFEPGGRHSFNTSCEIVEALQKAKEQGKARFVGFSSHDRRWIKFMIEYFPAIDVVCFPFTTMSKRAPKDSLFAALKKCDVGAFGIKPFGAGSLFRDNREKDNQRARLALRYILLTNTVIPIPGMNSLEQVDNVIKAVTERRTMDVEQRAELQRAGNRMWAQLAPNYRWLRNWEYV